MHCFLEGFNRTRSTSNDGILRAGLAHVWFESIHPFEDGNGRIGRAIIDMALARMLVSLHAYTVSQPRYGAVRRAITMRSTKRNVALAK
jgi:Fic family protein